MGKAVDEIRVDTGIVRGISDESKSFETGENFLEHDATLDAGEVPEDLAKRLREMGAW